MVKKLLKTIASICMALLCIAGVAGCSSNFWDLIIPDTLQAGSMMYAGQFGYEYLNAVGGKTRKEANYVIVACLSELGKTDYVITIPNQIDGKDVIMAGGLSGLGYSFSLDEGIWEWLYLPSTIEAVTSIGICSYNRYILLQNCDNLNFLYNGGNVRIFVSEELYDRFITAYDITEATMDVRVANTAYISNGTTYYISEHKEGDLLENIPEDPLCDGYEFGGWYTEEACLNKWDFVNDTFTLPENESILRLYAKWLIQ